jgi:DNA-binding response OmpR family regulator
MNKILIVEDDPVNMFLYRKALENDDNEIIMSSNGNDACEIARRYDPDIILLDVFLPGKSGFDVFDELKSSDDRCANIPVIFASASFDKESIIEKTGCPRELVMQKPINFRELISLVNRIKSNINNKTHRYA